MKITETRCYPVNSKKKKSSLLAFASVTFDKALVVKNFRVIDGSKGVFVAWPSQGDSDGNFYDTVFSLTDDLRDKVNEAILDEWENTDEDERPVKKSGKKSGKKSPKKSREDDEDDDDDQEDD